MYIVQATSKAFIKVINNEFVITSNENDATKYEKIGCCSAGNSAAHQ